MMGVLFLREPLSVALVAGMLVCITGVAITFDGIGESSTSAAGTRTLVLNALPLLPPAPAIVIISPALHR